MLTTEQRQRYAANIDFACRGCFEAEEGEERAASVLKASAQMEIQTWGQACLDSGVNVSLVVEGLINRCDGCLEGGKYTPNFMTHTSGIRAGIYEDISGEIE